VREPVEQDLSRPSDGLAPAGPAAVSESDVAHLPRNVERHAVTGVVWLGASSLVNRLVLMATMAVLATRLDPRDFGMLAVVTLVSQTVLIFNDFGFSDALVYQPTSARQAAETMLVAVLAGSGALAAALFLGAPTIARFFRVPDAVAILRAYSFVVLVNGIGSSLLGVLTRELAFARRSSVEAVPAIVGGIVTIPLALSGVGVWSLAIGDMARAVLILVLVLVALPARLRPHWHRDVAREMRPYAQKSVASTALDFALQNVDYLLVGRLLGPVALGYYSLAFRMASLPILLVTNVVGGVAFPAFARLLPNRGRVRSAFETQMRVANAVMFLAGGGLVVLAPSLQVLGAKWGPAVPVARALGLYICLRSAAAMTTPLLQAVGAPGSIAWLRAAWAAGLAALIATVGRQGIATVGEIQVLVALALLVAHALVARRLAGIDLAAFAASIVRPALAATLAGLVTAAVHASLGATLPRASLPGFLLLGALFTAVYAGSLTILQPALRRDVPALLAILRREKART
jgi:O-antigen/teichoic acid export membrane protein